MRWLVLDEILRIEKGRKVLAKSHVPETDEASAEMLMIEMMAQTGGILLGAESDFQENVVFAKIDEARFYPGFKPSEKIEIESSSEALRPEGSWIQSVITSGRGKVAEARLMLANAGEIVPGRRESVTFHKTFMEHFKVREKVK